MGYHQIAKYMQHEDIKRWIERRTQRLFEELMAKNFPNLKKEMDIHNQEAQ